MNSRRINIALTAISVSITLLIPELILRARGLYSPPDNPIRAEVPDKFQGDESIGYRLWPSRRTVLDGMRRGESSSIPLVSNSDGFRSSREFDEPDERLRILVIGDSFVFGLGVHEKDRVTEQLEAMEPGWRVDNMGMAGWGVDLMIRALEKFGPKVKPDVVVLAIYADDFLRLLPYFAGMGYPLPKFELSGSELVTVPFPYPNPLERLRVVQWFYQRRWNRHHNLYNRNRYDLHTALLDRYLKDATTMDFRPVVTFFPVRGGGEEENQDRRRFLQDWTSQKKVPYIDLTDVFHEIDDNKTFLPGDIHWNAAGHRLAAEQLLVFLRQSLNDPR
jgi:hypothetical protein